MFRFLPESKRGGIANAGFVAVITALLASAALIRIRAAENNLWLDEISSLNSVRQISSPLEIFYRIHSDNNHYLNTIWLYIAGFRGDWFGYRVPSLLAGIGTVALAGVIGLPRGMTCAVLAMILTSFSYVLILYSSEARGYSALVFFSFLSFHLMNRYLAHQHWQIGALFSLTCCFGFLSHLTFLTFFLSSLIWFAFRLSQSRQRYCRYFASLTLCYGLPTLLFAVLYWLDVRRMVFNGGDNLGLFYCYRSSLAWTLGLPSETLNWLMFAIASMLLFLGIHLLWRERSDMAVFFVGAIVVLPVLLVFVSRPTVLYVRYFIIPIAFSLVLLSFVFAALCTAWKGRGRVLCGFVLAGYFLSNGPALAALLNFGRGETGECIRYLLRNSKETPVTVTGNQDFRVGSVVDFYTQTMHAENQLVYCPADRLPVNEPEWFISSKDYYSDPTPQAKTLYSPAGRRYELERIYPCAPLSGLPWFVYHRK